MFDNEIVAEFNFRNNIVLSIAGITDTVILERSAKQEKTESLWEKWMIEELVFRGTGEREVISVNENENREDSGGRF